MSPNFLNPYQQGMETLQQDNAQLQAQDLAQAQQQLPQQGPQQAQQAPPASPPEPLSQSEKDELLTLQNQYAQANQQLAGKQIFAEDHQDMMSQIVPRKNALEQRQKAAADAQKKQAVQDSMETAALQQGIVNVHMTEAMRAIPQNVAHVVDPLTGEVETFVPLADGKGGFKVEPVKYERAQKRLEAFTSPDVGYTPSNESTEPGLQNPVPQTGSSVSSILGGRGDNNAPTPEQLPPPTPDQPVPIEQFAQQQADLKSFKSPGEYPLPKITNLFGENVDRRLVPKPTPGGAEDLNHISVEAGQEFYRRANAMVPPLSPNATIHEQLARQQQVDEMVRQQGAQHLLMKRHKADREASDVQHKQRMELQADAAQKKLEHEIELKHADWLLKQKEKQTIEGGTGLRGNVTEEGLSKIIQHYDAAIATERHQATSDVAKAAIDKVPEHLLPENHATELEKRVNNHLSMLEKAKGIKAGGQPAPGGGSPPPATPTPTPTPSATTEPPPVIPEDILKKPSRIDVGRVREVLPFVKNGLAVATTEKQAGRPEGVLAEPLQTMHDILQKAHTENRNLNVGERKDYEDAKQEVEGKIGGKASWLELESPGGVRKPLPKPFQPASTVPSEDARAKAVREAVSARIRLRESKAEFERISAKVEPVRRKLQNKQITDPAHEEELRKAVNLITRRSLSGKTLPSMSAQEQAEYNAAMKTLEEEGRR